MSERETAVVEQANQLVRQPGCLVDFFAGERKALLGLINEFGDAQLLVAAEAGQETKAVICSCDRFASMGTWKA